VCGILGYSHITRRLPAGVLGRALESLTHRGPDRQGRFVSREVSLGAVRLRILDLESGDQPLRSPDGDVIVAHNGEIFNFRELRDELQSAGATFHTNCDTEVVLQAFLHWGEGCLARFRGMFAIAIWVQSERRLLLARDRMGIKPLYYYKDGSELYFGSELKAILAHPDVPRQICLDGLDCYLSLNYVPGPLTLIEGIRKLMPGELLDWQNGRCELRRYVRPAVVPPPHSEDEACEELDRLLGLAVKEQLVADVPLGIWASGGLDSTTILHYAAQEHPGRLHTFSVTFRGRGCDESKYIRQVCQRFGTDHTEFDLNETADLAGAIERIAYYSDEPSADAGAIPAWFLAGITRKQVTVVLTGEGADELFAGYLTYRADRYAAAVRRLPASLRRAALSCASHLPVSGEKIGFEYKVKRFLEGSLAAPSLAHIFWNGTFSLAQKAQLVPWKANGALRAVLDSMGRDYRLGDYLAFDQRYYLPDDILYKVDRMTMAHSVESRPPFLDPRIVDFAASLPDDFKLRGRTSKYVLRRLMKDKLPAAVLSRPKEGFDIPVHDWFRGVLRPLLLDTLTEEAVSGSGLFYWPAVEQLLRAHLERKANYGYHLWGLLVLFIWMRRWKVELNVEQPAERAAVCAAG